MVRAMLEAHESPDKICIIVKRPVWKSAKNSGAVSMKNVFPLSQPAKIVSPVPLNVTHPTPEGPA